MDSSLQTSTHPPALQPAASTRSAPLTAIGPYRVVSRLASGGMGDVYHCLDERLGISVAVKVAHPALAADPDAFAHIRDEARRLASIKDRTYVLRVLAAGDVSVDGVDVPYIAMEFVADAEELGGPVSSAWSLEKKIEFFIKVCAGVQAMHEQHLVHADLKPANILVVGSANGGGEPRIIDFGIARVVRRAGGHPDQLVGGTPDYFDPALASNPDARPDHHTDIYCLGLTLATFLTGVRRHNDQQSAESLLTGGHHELPVELKDIILKAISPDPGKRFGSVRSFQAALLRFASIRTSLPSRFARSVKSAAATFAEAARTQPIISICIVALVATALTFAAYAAGVGNSAIAHWSQGLAKPTPEALAPRTLDKIRIVLLTDEQLPAFAQAAKQRGVDIPLAQQGGSRMAWVALSDKLVEAGGISVVGFDFYIDQHFPAFDQQLKAAFERLAAASSAGAVVMGVANWGATLLDQLQNPDRIRGGSLGMNEADDRTPAFAQLACRMPDHAHANPAFCLLLASLAANPGAEPRVSYASLDRLTVDFFRKDALGNTVPDPPSLLISLVQVQKASTLQGTGAPPDALIALIPLAAASDEAFAASSKSAVDVLQMTNEELRSWHGGRPILVARAPDAMFRTDRRVVPGYQLQAATVQKILSYQVLREPNAWQAVTAAFAVSLMSACAAWQAVQWLRRRVGRTHAGMISLLLVALVLLAGFGGLWIAQELGYFLNPLPIAMAAFFAGVLSAFLFGMRRTA